MERNSLLRRADRPLLIPTYDGTGQCVHPDIVRIESLVLRSRFLMTFEPYPYADDSLENPSIVCSDDGLEWRVPEGVVNPVVEPPRRAGAWNSDGDTIVTPDGRLLLIYRYNSGDGETTCFLKSSSDGILWSTPAKLFTVATSGRFASPAMVHTGSQFEMYSVDTIDETINVFTSDDAFTWNQRRVLFGFDRAWHLDATVDDGWTYLLVNDKHSLYLFRGRDQSQWLLLTEAGWREYAEISGSAAACKSLPVVSPSQSSWDGGLIYRSSCLIEGTDLQLWYGAKSKENEWNVGFTSGSIPR